MLLFQKYFGIMLIDFLLIIFLLFDLFCVLLQIFFRSKFGTFNGVYEAVITLTGG